MTIPTAQQFRQWREDRKLTRTIVAKELDCSTSTLTNFETIGFTSRSWRKYGERVVALMASDLRGTAKQSPRRSATPKERALALTNDYLKRNPTADRRLVAMRAETEVGVLKKTKQYDD